MFRFCLFGKAVFSVAAEGSLFKKKMRKNTNEKFRKNRPV